MNLTLKALGLGLLVALAVSSFTVMNVSANSEGHFITGSVHTEVKQTTNPNSPHQLEFFMHGLEGGIICDEATATGTASAETVTDGIGNISFPKCHTTGSETISAVDVNDCQLQATVAKGTTSSTEQTEHLICPPGQSIVITHPNCTVTVSPQTFEKGFTYTPITENGKHAITVDVNIQLQLQFHAGLCVFTGTNHTGTLKGATVVRGLNTLGEQVSITAT
jgi:hypothetical protein